MSKTESPSQSERIPIADAHFAVESRLAIQLGRESISSSITAIIELVKNAYDADASCARIRFGSLGSDEATMVIEDDGRGMTADDIVNYWMVIGTPNKAQLRRAGGKRVLTGEKGLGRLGLDRLATHTIVQTKTKESPAGVELPIDWSLFEKEDQRLEDVPLKLFDLRNLDTDPLSGEQKRYAHGTRLILRGLKDKWTEETLAELRAELSLLVSPFSTDQEFAIELDSGMAIDSIDGKVSAPISLLEAAQWKVAAKIDEDGSVQMRMDSKHHDRIYEVEPVLWEKKFPGWGDRPRCGPLKLEFYFIPRKPTNLGEQTFSTRSIRSFLDANQGIRIYRDGFRVKPYGNPNGEGDWLRLAFRRQESPSGPTQDDKPGNWRVGYNQIVGATILTRSENEELLDQTNREGLVDGEAFSHLRVFAEDTIRFFELNHQDFELSRHVDRDQREEAKVQADEAITKLGEAAGAIAALVDSEGSKATTPSSNTQKTHDPSELLSKAHRALIDAQENLEESSKKFRAENEKESREKDTMANLASLGILAAAFGHETLGWASSCAANAGWLERNLPDYFFFANDEIQEKVQEKLSHTSTQARRIETFAGFSIGNVKPAKRRRTTFCLKKVILNVFKTFDESLRVQRNIELDVEQNMPDGPCHIKGYPIDWESVLVNLITNSEWALRERRDEIYQRKLRVVLKRVETEYVLTVDDNGVGIPAGKEKEIFLPTITSKRNASGNLCGTGMGLAIVKNFVEHNTGGQISVVANGDLGGASFQIRVPAVEQTETKS